MEMFLHVHLCRGNADCTSAAEATAGAAAAAAGSMPPDDEGARDGREGCAGLIEPSDQ